MTEDNELVDRFWYLHEALQYDTQEEQFFSDVDRILINQERARIWERISDSSYEPRPVSLKIETKINHIHRLIEATQWTPKRNEDEFKRNQSK